MYVLFWQTQQPHLNTHRRRFIRAASELREDGAHNFFFLFYFFSSSSCKPCWFFQSQPSSLSQPGSDVLPRPGLLPPSGSVHRLLVLPADGPDLRPAALRSVLLLSRSLSPVRSLSATRHLHLRNFCFDGPHCAREPFTRFSHGDRWRAASSINSAPPRPTLPSCRHRFLFFSSSASLCSPFFIHFFHLQVLCGQALKLRPGCPRRPLVVSLGFSASALHTLRASKAICTTHIPTKASCDLTLPHRITPPSSAPFIPLFGHCREALSCFRFFFFSALPPPLV